MKKVLNILSLIIAVVIIGSFFDSPEVRAKETQDKVKYLENCINDCGTFVACVSWSSGTKCTFVKKCGDID